MSLMRDGEQLKQLCKAPGQCSSFRYKTEFLEKSCCTLSSKNNKIWFTTVEITNRNLIFVKNKSHKMRKYEGIFTSWSYSLDLQGALYKHIGIFVNM
jgi:hypothetical protein